MPVVSPVKNPSSVPILNTTALLCTSEQVGTPPAQVGSLVTLPQHPGLGNEKHMFPAHSSLILVFPVAFPPTKTEILGNALASNSVIETHNSVTLLSLCVRASYGKCAKVNDSSPAGFTPFHLEGEHPSLVPLLVG